MVDIKEIIKRKNQEDKTLDGSLNEASLEKKAALQAVANSIIGSTISSKPVLSGEQ